jgi:hypothetical protein
MSIRRSTEEIQYEKMMIFLEKLLKYGSIVFTTVFSTLVITFGVLFFQDRKSMQEERTAMQESYNNKVKSLEEQINALKVQSQETINQTQNKTESEILAFKKSANGEVTNVKNNANSEISKIKISATDLALKESAKQVDNVFKQDKIQKIIENKATDAIQEKIPELVTTQINAQSEGILKIASWASMYRQGSFYDNLNHLRNFEVWLNEEFKDPDYKQRVRNLNYQIEQEYNNEARARVWSIDLEKLHLYDKDIPEKATHKEAADIIQSKIYSGENLHTRCERIHLLNKLLGTSYRCFDSFRP